MLREDNFIAPQLTFVQISQLHGHGQYGICTVVL
jgi:hypothetical protein